MELLFDRKIIERRFNELKQEFNNWKGTFQEIQSYIDPSLGFFEGNQPNKGDKLNHKILLDDTASKSLGVLAAGFQSGLTPQSRQWFKLQTPDPDLNQIESVKDWMNIVTERMMMVFSKSNIYNVLHSMYLENGAFAVAAALIEEDRNDVIRGRDFTAGEFFLGTGPDRRVNTFARVIQMTALQMVEMFGEDNVREDIKTAYNNNQNTESWFQVCHIIEPNDKRIPNRKDFNNMAFRSVYWDPADKSQQVLRLSGYRTFPVITMRWKTTGPHVYSRSSPGWKALGNSKTLQKMNEKQLKALDKHVDPPLQAHSSVRTNGGVNALPNGVTYYDSSTPDAGLRPAYEVQYPFQVDQSIARKQNEVKETFYNHLFLTVIDQQPGDRTAYETAKLWEEKLTQLGPVVESTESETLDLLIDRVFDIMQSMGLFPEPPQELQGLDLNVEYTSMLAMAQKAAEATSIQQVAQFIGIIAQYDPSALDKGNWDEMIDRYGEIVGLPPKIIRSDQEVAGIRKNRAQQQLQQQQMQNAANAIQGAKLLSETKTGDQSALTAMMGGQ